jgi:hypothetical protein
MLVLMTQTRMMLMTKDSMMLLLIIQDRMKLELIKTAG